MLAEFMQYVNTTKQLWPLEGRNPTALMPPTTVVRVQVLMLALHTPTLSLSCLTSLGLGLQNVGFVVLAFHIR
jgi:hypothetical protein